MNFRVSCGRSRRWQAFTLIELLVAMAVLALLVGLLAEITGSALSTWNRSEKVLSGGDAARPLEQRIANDFRLMALKGGLARFTASGETADSRSSPYFGFYIQNAGPDEPDPRLLTFVEYEWDESSSELEGRPALFRRQLAFDWGKTPDFNAEGAPSNIPNTSPPIEGVLAFQFDFLTPDGTWQDTFARNADGKDPIATRVAYVTAPGDVVRILDERDQLDDVVNALQSNASGSESPAERWRTRLDNLAATGRISPDLISSIQPSQRLFAIPAQE